MENKNKRFGSSDCKCGLGSQGENAPVFFCFVCRGTKEAAKQIAEYIKGKTDARVIFQRISNRYLTVSEVQLKPIATSRMPKEEDVKHG